MRSARAEPQKDVHMDDEEAEAIALSKMCNLPLGEDAAGPRRAEPQRELTRAAVHKEEDEALAVAIALSLSLERRPSGEDAAMMPERYWIRGNTNLRENPIDGPCFNGLLAEHGTRAEILEESGEFVRIECDRGIGWIKRKYLEGMRP